VASLRRAFVAVVPPAVVLDAVEAAAVLLRSHAPPSLTWTRRAQWHLTVGFLGPVPDAAALVDVLRTGLAGARAVTLALAAGGAFPSPARASVLWIGVGDGADDLAQLAGAVGQATVPLGFRPDERPYHAHLTLARSRRPRSLAALVAMIGDGAVGRPWPAREVVLFESDTRPDGARYTAVERFPLSA
jgi:2'-5' RNA ligase